MLSKCIQVLAVAVVALAFVLPSSAADSIEPTAELQDLLTHNDHHHTRLLLQSVDPNTIKGLQAARDGDVRARNQLYSYLYVYIGCGGSTRTQKPQQVAAALQDEVAKNPEMKKANVVKVSVDVIKEAAYDLQNKVPGKPWSGNPPTRDDCDRAWGTGPYSKAASAGGRRLLQTVTP